MLLAIECADVSKALCLDIRNILQTAHLRLMIHTRFLFSCGPVGVVRLLLLFTTVTPCCPLLTVLPFLAMPPNFKFCPDLARLPFYLDRVGLCFRPRVIVDFSLLCSWLFFRRRIWRYLFYVVRIFVLICALRFQCHHYFVIRIR